MTTLAIIIVSFSLLLYGLAQEFFRRQTQARLDLIQNAVSSSIESNSRGLEWEPQERSHALNFPFDSNQVFWCVFDKKGRIVGKSAALPRFVAESKVEQLNDAPLEFQLQYSDDTKGWTIRQESFESPHLEIHDDEKFNERYYSTLLVISGVSQHHVDNALTQLSIALIVMTIFVWLVTLLTGQWICRLALRPVRDMAASIRNTSTSDMSKRLDKPSSHDELSDLSDSFNRLMDRLQDSFLRQKRFTGDAAHQLKTPLTAMIGQVDVALRRSRSAEEYRHTLEALKYESDRLRQIIESLLFLAREDSEASRPKFEAIDLAQLLPSFIDNWKNHPRYEDIQLVKSSDGKLFINSHRDLFGELLRNLMENALKYSPKGSPVTVEMSGEGENAIVSIADKGMGIGDKDLSQIFDPFFRSSTSREKGVDGLGLGLSIARRITLALGADLSVKSHIGEGSTFTICFPNATRN
ncbi:ATP-binding protein [Calycomorphotria hydatis]|nr:ATP-binding protein [Calycomorphotria hydatis]